MAEAYNWAISEKKRAQTGEEDEELFSIPKYFRGGSRGARGGRRGRGGRGGRRSRGRGQTA